MQERSETIEQNKREEKNHFTINDLSCAEFFFFLFSFQFSFHEKQGEIERKNSTEKVRDMI